MYKPKREKLFIYHFSHQILLKHFLLAIMSYDEHIENTCHDSLWWKTIFKEMKKYKWKTRTGSFQNLTVSSLTLFGARDLSGCAHFGSLNLGNESLPLCPFTFWVMGNLFLPYSPFGDLINSTTSSFLSMKNPYTLPCTGIPALPTYPSVLRQRRERKTWLRLGK